MQIELLVLNLLYELDVNLTMSNCPFWCKCHFILLQENMICLDFNKNYISTKSLFSGWLWRSCPAWRVRNCPPCLTGGMHLRKKFIWEVKYIFERIIYGWWNTFVKATLFVTVFSIFLQCVFLMKIAENYQKMAVSQ